MKKFNLMLLVLFTLLFSLNVNAAVYEFDILFDDNPFDGLLIDDGTGTGTFSFDTGTLPLGSTYLLSDMTVFGGSFSFDITFPAGLGYSSVRFTEDNIVNNFFHPIGWSVNAYDTSVVISSDEQFVTFEGSGSPRGGALDFWDPATNYYLSFDGGVPVYFLNDLGANALVVMGDNGMTSAVPVPAAVWLFGSGVAGLALLRRRRS